ncbi:thioredoxin family protein [Adlercreutzia mucosicola]|uniref:thioredoxin family protein n=1 Tax=Adlercreutzia mucosicola TaxID=580026 RepID=UPI0004035AC7|nr:thioredoxin family protein [Adlercreutzia mucosicola]MCR2034624.1 thioredoxin family protein [Adlercreutzia mucosicola]MEB1814891.1 thioredoxin family protein [Adlercreutzia mucosicola]
MIEILNEGNFPEKVLQAPHKVLVEFFAAWCPHCQRMMPIIDDVADAAAGRVAVYQVDIDQSPNLAGTYAPDGFPTFALFEGGSEVESLVGEQSKQRLLELVA